MKQIILICLFAPLFSIAQNGCPISGDNKNPKIQAADRLKNRSYFPDIKTAHPININLVLSDKANDTGLVYMDGYLTYAKISGIESCECHSTKPEDLDYHIYIGLTPKALKKECVIVEVTRFSRIVNSNLQFKYIKSLTGKKVRIYGYLFEDKEHKSAIGTWRKGITEIHPVFLINPI